MAATKTQPVEKIRGAYAAGIRLFGENRVIEAAEKYQGFHEDAELHLIGHLQRNKADTAAKTFTCVQSIDKIATVRALEKYLDPDRGKMHILLEYNTSLEESKYGCRSEDELFSLAEEILDCSIAQIRGLMTVGPFTADEKRIREAFSLLRSLSEQVSLRFPEVSMDELSMGMSSDYGIAVEEGATIVRLGTVLFGSRM